MGIWAKGWRLLSVMRVQHFRCRRLAGSSRNTVSMVRRSLRFQTFQVLLKVRMSSGHRHAQSIRLECIGGILRSQTKAFEETTSFP